MTRRLVALSVGLMLAFTVCAFAVAQDLIFYNGTIVPMTEPDVSYSAMLVRGATMEGSIQNTTQDMATIMIRGRRNFHR